MSSILGFSQLSEVKGVETKLAVYDGSEYEVTACNDYGHSFTKHSTKWFGYSFYNMNSIPVSVEAELYEQETGKLVTTKTFNLKSNETYIWKHESKHYFQVNWVASGFGCNEWTDSKKAPGKYNSSDEYYVKYKAYKIL